MIYYKIVLTPSQEEEQTEIETFAEGIRTTLKNSTEFSVFSTTTRDNITIYFSPLTFELCTVLNEKFGFSSFEYTFDDFNALSELTE